MKTKIFSHGRQFVDQKDMFKIYMDSASVGNRLITEYRQLTEHKATVEDRFKVTCTVFDSNLNRIYSEEDFQLAVDDAKMAGETFVRFDIQIENDKDF